MSDDRSLAAGHPVRVRALVQLDEGERACFAGEVVASDVAVDPFTPGDLVAGFGGMSGVTEVPPADLLRVSRELGPQGGVMIPPLTLGMRAARRARTRRGECVLLIGGGSVAWLVQVALEANGIKVSMLSEPTSALAVNGTTLAVDTTGDPAVILRLFEEMPKMARIVLAGRGNGRTADVDLYRTIHQRGLEVIGVALFPEGGLEEDLAAAEKLFRAQRAAIESTLSDRLRRLQD
jgi:threonine dehydrogenase-like Zn-dependent dehydrogenase